MLTPKQEAFCLNYSIMRNATQAAIKSGYSPKSVMGNNSILKNPKIQQRLNELNMSLIAEFKGKIADKGERLETLTEIIRDEYKSPVTAKEKVMAVSEVNKMLGDYAPEKHAVVGDIIIEVVYRDKNVR